MHSRPLRTFAPLRPFVVILGYAISHLHQREIKGTRRGRAQTGGYYYGTLEISHLHTWQQHGPSSESLSRLSQLQKMDALAYNPRISFIPARMLCHSMTGAQCRHASVPVFDARRTVQDAAAHAAATPDTGNC